MPSSLYLHSWVLGSTLTTLRAPVGPVGEVQAADRCSEHEIVYRLPRVGAAPLHEPEPQAVAARWPRHAGDENSSTDDHHVHEQGREQPSRAMHDPWVQRTGLRGPGT